MGASFEEYTIPIIYDTMSKRKDEKVGERVGTNVRRHRLPRLRRI